MSFERMADHLLQMKAERLKTGTGTPEGVLAAPAGTLYIDMSASPKRVWSKRSGSGKTGWESLKNAVEAGTAE